MCDEEAVPKTACRVFESSQGYHMLALKLAIHSPGHWHLDRKGNYSSGFI